jgi:uncharacterized spore protein YtfJ
VSGRRRSTRRDLVVNPGAGLPGVRKLVARLGGAKLCYGSPVQAHGHTVIPVASVRAAGGMGFGRSAGLTPEGEPADLGNGGGGGGALEARPIGFIEIGPHGARYESIEDGRAALGALAGGLVLLVLTRGRHGAWARALPRGARAVLLGRNPSP